MILLLESVHGESKHKGKHPTANPDNIDYHYRFIRLRTELRQAVASEDYESAASLRDDIRDAMMRADELP